MRRQLNVIVGSSFKCYRKSNSFLFEDRGGGYLASKDPYLVYYVTKHRPLS